MTITHRKRQPQPPEEIQSRSTSLRLFPPLTPDYSRDGAWSPDRMRQLSLRSHPLCQNQVCGFCLRARRRRRHLSLVFLQWKRIREAQTQSSIPRRGMNPISAHCSQPSHLRSQELHSYPILTEDWGADEYVTLVILTYIYLSLSLSDKGIIVTRRRFPAGLGKLAGHR